jgi:CDP-4-dehydro-6-deoxyglucose reductase
MTFTITVEPSGRTFSAESSEAMLAAGIRQGIGLPYGCKDGACGSCKCKLLNGSVVHGPHQSKALSADEEAAGFVLTCCGVAHSDVVLESRQVTEVGAFPIKKMPVRVNSLERASNDVIVLSLQLPASDAFQYRAGQYVEFLLRDGDKHLKLPECEFHICITDYPYLDNQFNRYQMAHYNARHWPSGHVTFSAELTRT